MIKTYPLKCIVLLVVSVITFSAGNSQAEKQNYEKTTSDEVCSFDPEWITSPSFPTDVDKSGWKRGVPDSTFCDFYRFAWQEFFFLTSDTYEAGVPNFQNNNIFPFQEKSGDDSCDEIIPPDKHVYARDKKIDSIKSDRIPLDALRSQQAGGAYIYDYKDNIVGYEVRFNKSLCDFKASVERGNLPAGTTELKLSWRILEKNDNHVDKYFTSEVDIDKDQNKELLGLVGFHVAVSTPEHPAMVWITWEHDNNVPNCKNPGSHQKGFEQWAFISKDADKCLHDAKTDKEVSKCINYFNINESSTYTGVKGKASNICRAYRYGTGKDPERDNENIDIITSMNEAMRSNSNAGVWGNYLMIGALWLSDELLSSGSSTLPTNQRGSLQLTNSTMETNEQGDFSERGDKTSAENCFHCHKYNPGKTAISPSISHIFKQLHGK